MQDAVDDALAPQVCVNQIGGGTRTPIVAESSAPAAVVDAHWIRTTFWGGVARVGQCDAIAKGYSTRVECLS